MPTISEIVGIFILCRKQKSSCHDTTTQKKAVAKRQLPEVGPEGHDPTTFGL